MVLGTIVGADSTSSSSSESSKAKKNLHWGGRSYTQYGNWFYFNSTYGTSYYLMHTNYGRTTLGDFANSLPVNTYPAAKHPGFTSPIDGVIKSVVYSFHSVTSYTGTFQFGLIHGTIDPDTSSATISTTNVNIGDNGESATGNDAALEQIASDAQHRYIASKDGINHSVKKGDMIMAACRRTTDVLDSAVRQLNLSIHIVIEEE